MIKRIVAPLFAAGVSLAAFAQDLPQPSPLGVVEQTIGLTKVKVTYSRPSMKGRKIFGGLVPFGQVWRTGANKATRIELSGPVMIDGVELSAGTYGLFTEPNEGTWMFMFNKDAEQSGTSKYDAKLDVVQAKAKPVSCGTTETFTIDFANVSADHADLELRWEGTAVRLTLVADPMKQAMVNIDAAVKDTNTDFNGYNRMARFCVDHDVRTKDALQWAQRSVAMEKHYWNLFTLALAQNALGLKHDAIPTAQEALEMAQKEGDASTATQIDAKLKEWTGGK